MKISVIIPIYNSSAFLDRSVSSVRNQTYPIWELILIDDGSKDSSFEMMQKYSADDNRIISVHQENAGAGMARNKGLSLATGEYIVFLDSDDEIDRTYFEKLSKHDEDVVFIDVKDVDERGNIIRREYMSPFKDYPLDDIIRAQMTGKIPWGGVRKAAKRDLINNYNIRYSSHKIGEEALYSFMLLDSAKSVAFIEEPLYSYILRSDSLSNSKDDDPWGEVSTNLRYQIKNEYLSGDSYEKYATTLNAFSIAACAVSLQRLALSYTLTKYYKLAIKRKKNLITEIDEHYPIDWTHLNKKANIVGRLIKYNCFVVIWFLSRVQKLR